jgi:hypothetical protein
MFENIGLACLVRVYEKWLNLRVREALLPLSQPPRLSAAGVLMTGVHTLWNFINIFIDDACEPETYCKRQ